MAHQHDQITSLRTFREILENEPQSYILQSKDTETTDEYCNVAVIDV